VLGRKRAQRLARRAIMFSETPLNDVITMLDIVGLDSLFFSLRQRLSRREAPIFALIPGVQALLEQFAERWTLGVVTTRSQEAAAAFLAQHDLTGYFPLVVTRETTRRLKPHPAPILHAADELGVPVERCVMVGDTPVDTVSARRAGAWAVGVLCGFGEEDELYRAGAHLVLPSTADLLPWVDEASLS
jgi:HAD superfamily hydrolase (TIGR01509 family)